MEFHPAVQSWFERAFSGPTEPQRRGWPSIAAGRHTLIAAPTGHGKTLAGFLAALDELVREGVGGGLPDETRVVYVSPLKALSHDIEKNLSEPIAGIRRELAAGGFADVDIRVQVRTGDTPMAERARMMRRPPHLFVTTPESLYILLTSEGGRRMLRTARMVIVDEIHAVLGDKRGSHLALSLERLDAVCERKLVRVGLSATQKPIEAVARFLVGEERDCTIVDSGHARRMDLGVELPRSPLEAVMAGEVWLELYDRLAQLISEHRTTLVFVNTRKLAERVGRFLGERLGEEVVASHHGSLARHKRLDVEQRLKHGQLKALVATSSLELGIDIGSVDLVCQLGTTTSIAMLLQRIGRSGHTLGGLPKGRLFPLTRDQLVECAALLDCVRRGELDRLEIPEAPLDILAQQIVAEVACGERGEDELFELVRRAWPFRELSREDYDAVVTMLADGFVTGRGRRAAFLHRDAVNRRLRARRGARLQAITSGGAIPDNADYEVVADPSGMTVGTLNEDFAIESNAGDIFQLGNTSWQILRVEAGRVRVADAQGKPPTIPFWLGEAPARTAELSAAVSRVRTEVAQRLASLAEPPSSDDPAVSWLRECGLPPGGALEAATYLAEGMAALGVMPTQETLVLERFFDESGGMQLVVHAPFGSRVNRAWGLSLRKRFCRKFNFELQAAATEDAIILSLGPTHSFPLDDVFRFLNSRTVRSVLIQALLDAPMFGVRWRWNTGRALAVPRFRSGKKVPPKIQRMLADDLVAVVFPDQLACLENIVGEREVPDHPLVDQTIRDCLEEAMDIDGLEVLLRAMEAGEKELVARDLRGPSPFSAEVVQARPYSFLDDAPLEERRTMAVYQRRFADPTRLQELGRLDENAIRRVKEQAWPLAENADELHDALLLAGFVAEREGLGWVELMERLIAAGRATRVVTGGRVLWVAAEQLARFRAVLGELECDPELDVPARALLPFADANDALVALLRGRLQVLGPVSLGELGRPLGLPVERTAEVALALEQEGFALRGRFTPGLPDEEWCERGLLARIHSETLDGLRKQIQPVTPAIFLRFLFEWQRVTPATRAAGATGLSAVLQQLEGYSAAATAWETEILPARIEEYDPAWLDQLCLAGRVVWGRLVPPDAPRAGATPVRMTPLALLARGHLRDWLTWAPAPGDTPLGAAAERVLSKLSGRGAQFASDLLERGVLGPGEVEEGLAELVSRGIVTADTFAAVRALLTPTRADGRGGGCFGIEAAGRWDRLPRPEGEPGRLPSEAVETAARALLRRYGVLFRRLLEREPLAPPWRELLTVLHRLEARGEIRGGRFVEGFVGAQFALPEAVTQLRDMRKRPAANELVSVSAADPLNLVGIIAPGERVPAVASHRLLFRDGLPIAIRMGDRTEMLVPLEGEAAWQAQVALVGGHVPEPLRGWM